MLANKQLLVKDIALITCFAALYTLLSLLSISPIIGLPGKAITAAAIVAPLIGIILGPYKGFLSAILGGAIGFFAGFFSLPSLFSGIFATLCAGTISTGKRSVSVLTYFLLLFIFGVYPFVGPVWLYPPLMWFQITGFLILISPLSAIAVKNLNSNNDSKLLLAFFTICLTATLAGQIAGSLIFEFLSWPFLISEIDAWRANWQILSFLYPIERIIIAVSATLIGVSLHKVMKSANILPYYAKRQKV